MNAYERIMAYLTDGKHTLDKRYPEGYFAFLDDLGSILMAEDPTINTGTLAFKRLVELMEINNSGLTPKMQPCYNGGGAGGWPLIHFYKTPPTQQEG